MRKLVWAVRCSLCEILTSWALRIAPEGYTPSMVDACVRSAGGRDAVEEMAGAIDSSIIYLTAAERQTFQRALNSSVRRLFDGLPRS